MCELVAWKYMANQARARPWKQQHIQLSTLDMEGVKGRETPMGFVQVNSTNQIQKSKQQALLQNKTK